MKQSVKRITVTAHIITTTDDGFVSDIIVENYPTTVQHISPRLREQLLIKADPDNVEAAANEDWEL